MTDEILRGFTLEELEKELSRRAHPATCTEADPDVAKSVPPVDTEAGTNLSEGEQQLRSLDAKTIFQEIIYRQKVIYGVDNRMDMFMVKDEQVLRNADAVVGLFPAKRIVDNGDGTSTLKTKPFDSVPISDVGIVPLCLDETFRSQPRGPKCSGVLIREDIIATAGHCVNEQKLPDIRFVFGFRMQNQDKAITVIDNSDIYRGTKLLGRKLESDGSDWALVKLDKPVSNRRPAAFRREGKVSDGTDVYVIGHPVGLPTKYAPGAVIKNNAPASYFQANLDAYGGNSGSGVFNGDTHEIEGLLVRGSPDFVVVDDCSRSNLIPDSGPGGEACTRVSEFSSLLAAPKAALRNAHALIIGIS